MKAPRCPDCYTLRRRSLSRAMCGWPCSPLGFFSLLRGRVQARRRWLKRTLPAKFGRYLRPGVRR